MIDLKYWFWSHYVEYWVWLRNIKCCYSWTKTPSHIIYILGPFLGWSYGKSNMTSFTVLLRLLYTSLFYQYKNQQWNSIVYIIWSLFFSNKVSYKRGDSYLHITKKDWGYQQNLLYKQAHKFRSLKAVPDIYVNWNELASFIKTP
jgi:hypothetical protein